MSKLTLIGAPMSKDDLEQLMTLLYRAQGECFRRGYPDDGLGAALGITAVLMSTMPRRVLFPVTDRDTGDETSVA